MVMVLEQILQVYVGGPGFFSIYLTLTAAAWKPRGTGVRQPSRETTSFSKGNVDYICSRLHYVKATFPETVFSATTINNFSALGRSETSLGNLHRVRSDVSERLCNCCNAFGAKTL